MKGKIQNKGWWYPFYFTDKKLDRIAKSFLKSNFLNQVILGMQTLPENIRIHCDDDDNRPQPYEYTHEMNLKI